MDNKQLISSLAELGISRNDATIYISLLTLGQTAAGPLIKACKLHRQLVYQGLERLIEVGLATKSSRHNRSIFAATDPAELEHKFERQLAKAASLTPILRSKLHSKNSPVDVRVLYGREGLYENLVESVNSAKRSRCPVRMITGTQPIQFWEALGEEYSEKYLNLSEKSKVQKLLIADTNYPLDKKNRIFGQPGNELRFAKNLHALPSATRILKEYVSIEVYDPQVFIIQIISPIVAQSYINFFEIMWAAAKDDKPLAKTKKPSAAP